PGRSRPSECRRSERHCRRGISQSRCSRAVLMKAPGRGEFWMVDLGMVAKVRPAVVISVPVDDSDRALATLVAHTTSARKSRFEVSISVPFLKPGVFDAQSLVTIPHAKLVRLLGRLTASQLRVVEQGVRRWLGLAATNSDA